MFAFSILFPYPNIYSQILNNKPLDILEYQDNNIVNEIRNIQVKEFSQYSTINRYSNTLHIANNGLFDSSTISRIFRDIYESKDTNQILLPLPTACVFRDGESPLNEYDCIPINNNEDVFG